MDNANISDHELWRKHQKGDMRAFNMLYGRYSPSLYRQASRWVKDRQDAEELVMDLFVSLWTRRDKLNPSAGENLSAYLATAMRNRITNYYQKKLRNIELTVETVPPIADSRTADYGVLSLEAEHAYEKGVASLSPQRRKVFKLSREEGLTYSQIAKRMNLSVNTVENYMVSALSILREKSKSWLVIACAALLSLLS